jgi:hypothetical protein
MTGWTDVKTSAASGGYASRSLDTHFACRLAQRREERAAKAEADSTPGSQDSQFEQISAKKPEG